MSDSKIRLGISTCLLGENVRYNGGHKLDKYLRDSLGAFVEWVPVCPEYECGFGVPREAVRLVGNPEYPRLVTSKSGKDLTEPMQKWIKKRLEELEKEALCGFVFKSKSPSSGMQGVKVYTEAGMPSKRGSGMFAGAFMNHFPLLPVEEDGRLHDAGLRENFIERIFVFKRWMDFVKDDGSPKGLIDFHSDHKLLIMAHSPQGLKELGKLVAQSSKVFHEDLFIFYLETLMRELKLQATKKKNTNVLQHIMGYFKKVLSADEKKELLEVIEEYYNGMIPLIVPIVLLKHYVRKYQEPYLLRQHYLHPHPDELMLRNHV